MNYLIRTLGLFFMVIFVLTSTFSQGLQWESAITRDGKSDTSVSTSYYMPKMFRVSGAAGDQGIIIRLDRKLFILVNDAKKEYSEMTFDEMEAAMKKVGGAMGGAMAKMEKQMADMTPEQQKMMKEMMGDKMPGMKKRGKIEVSKTGEKQNISGYSCAKNVVIRDGKEFMALWTTTGIKGFAAMGEEMKEFGKRMAAMNPMGDQSESEAMMSVEGFPIQTEIAGVTTVVTKVEEASISIDTFEAPAGYKKVESELLKGLEKIE